MNHSDLSPGDRRLLRQALAFLLMLLPSAVLAFLQPFPPGVLSLAALAVVALAMLLALSNP